ncbi:DUF6468 domain-containing protein [Rhodosalinus sp. K401]|uniref:DUF6468 domain-containing protein n=1 Tax=Rhodosalinus sp. K401 TaxID=3239195 RepID=UPI003525416E
MELIADILLVAGALGAAFYCSVLARRLSRFNDLEGGMGGAVAVLSKQVDDMTRALDAAKETAGHSAESLNALTERAESVAKRLELLVASMHDLPSGDPGAEGESSEPAPAQPEAAAPPAEARKRSTVPFFMRRPDGDAQ